MPNTQQLKMEDMSIAYIRALCAVNGYSVGNVEHDNDGYDITINCKGEPCADCIRQSPFIRVQLKSSFAHIRDNADGSISYDLEKKNYDKLICTNNYVPYILVVLRMYEDENCWIDQTKDFLKITKCAYWKSLRGMSPNDNDSYITIRLTDHDLITKDVLKNIMIKVANEQML